MTTPSALQVPPRGVSAVLHARPTLEVAVLAGTLVEERHPRLAAALAADPRHRWQRVLDTASLLRAAAVDPVRALALAARERVLGPLAHTAAGVDHDPDLPAWRHALRVQGVLTVAAATGAPPSLGEAERYVREQRATAVLLGADPDDLPATLAEIGADVAAVRAGVAPLARTPSQVEAEGRTVPGSWAQTSRLALALVPAWARTGPSPVSEQALGEALRRLCAAAATP